MTLATLAAVLQPALHHGYAVPGLVCLGWEDMRAYTLAAQAEQAPLILQAGPGCRAHTPLPILAAMFRHLANSVDVPIVAHLDHAHSIDECKAALDAGFTSVMFDGSRLPLDENIAQTAAVAALAHAAGASCEGEIGFVGYAAGEASQGTDPDQAARFARETGIDAMAISIGNVHLQTQHGTGLDLARLDTIQQRTTTPSSSMAAPASPQPSAPTSPPAAISANSTSAPNCVRSSANPSAPRSRPTPKALTGSTSCARLKPPSPPPPAP